MNAQQLERHQDDDGTVTWRVLADIGDGLMVVLRTENDHDARRAFDNLVARARSAAPFRFRRAAVPDRPSDA
jgi:hypothetical protein